jgi:hypothetical protein
MPVERPDHLLDVAAGQREIVLYHGGASDAHGNLPDRSDAFGAWFCTHLLVK